MLTTPCKSADYGVSAADPSHGKNGKLIRCWRYGGQGHASRVSHLGKLELERAKWVSKPETHWEQTIEGKYKKGKGEDNVKKRSKETNAHIKKFMKVVTKQLKCRYYNPDPFLWLIGEANEAEVELNSAKAELA